MATKLHKYKTKFTYSEELGGPHILVRGRDWNEVADYLEIYYGLTRTNAIQRAYNLKKLVQFCWYCRNKAGAESVGLGLSVGLACKLNIRRPYHRGLIFVEALRNCIELQEYINSPDFHVSKENYLAVHPCSRLPPTMLGWKIYERSIIPRVQVGSGWILTAPFSKEEEWAYAHIRHKKFEWLAANLDLAERCFEKYSVLLDFRHIVARYGSFRHWVFYHILAPKTKSVSRFFFGVPDYRKEV